MICYHASSVARSDKQAAGQRFVFVSATSQSTELERRHASSDLVAKAWPQARKHPSKNGAASTMIRQKVGEPSFGSEVKWCTLANPTMNLRLFVDFEHPEPIVRDDVKNTADLVYSWEHDGHGRLASFYVVYFVEQSFRLRAYEQVNRLLAEVNVSSLTEWSMIALLRSSFAARSFLPAWRGLLSSVRERLLSQGKDPDRLLRGLNR